MRFRREPGRPARRGTRRGSEPNLVDRFQSGTYAHRTMKRVMKTTRTLGKTARALRFSLFLSVFLGNAFFRAQAETPENVATGAPLPFSPNVAIAHCLPAAPVRLAPACRPSREERTRKLWKLSLIPVALSQTLDISSSWGMRELNPVLAGRDGRFGIEAALVKVGVVGVVTGVEFLIVRHRPGAARAFERINWSGALLTSSFAAHNYAIR